MPASHPDLTKNVVRTVEVGHRYEITSRSAYLLSASLHYYSSGSISSYPYTTLNAVSALNATLSTNPQREDQFEAIPQWVLTVSDGNAQDGVDFVDGQGMYFPHGMYVDLTAAEPEGDGISCLLRVSYALRGEYCPAGTSPEEFINNCGVPTPGPAAELDEWDDDGTALETGIVESGAQVPIVAFTDTNGTSKVIIATYGN